MRISDYFQNPIKTYCQVQGEEVDVMVECDYQPPEPRVNAAEQAEVCEVRNMRGVSIMDSMYVCELTALEDRLLAEAKSAHASRKEDAAAFAREEREKVLAMNAAQRRIGA